VLVSDPAETDAPSVRAAGAQALLIALEPAVEDALDRYDAVLAEPGRLVIYDEVALAARREGWDAARWARHLAAKLGGHADVLPPGAGNDDAGPLPESIPGEHASPPAGATWSSSRDEPVDVPAPEPVGTTASDEMALEAMDFEPVADADASQEEALARAGDGIDFGGFTPEMMAIMADGDAVAAASAVPPAPESEAAAGAAAVPAAAAAADAEAGNVPEPPPAPVLPRLRADEMSLADIEPEPGARAPAGGFGGGFEEGGVVVLAGIGGPDAVRQFLVGLPAGFVRPIIVRQRLDGGRHDRLVRQMQRATALPVELAEAGRALVAGHVYILPDGMTTVAGDGAATFAATDAPVPVLAGLPASDSVVLLLSGSDPAVVPEILDAARQGALVAGQSPEESFDGAAAAALSAAGSEAHPATELARRVSTRWLSLKD
jgi:chemosensory pili system protein ChpB (putative protein-glutamate methylesterase)